MQYQDYTLTHFQPERLDGILKVLQDLWGNDYKNNLAYFKWKYIDNPHTEKPLCGVVLHQNNVVGFRGLFATKWQVTGKPKDFLILSSSDLCVHPDHRYKGLAFESIKFLVKTYAPHYPLLLALTISPTSLPVALKLGYLPLINKAYLNKSSITGLLSFLLSSKFKKSPEKKQISPGTVGPIEISRVPNPKAMAEVISSQAVPENKIRMIQDEQFFKWRYNNPRMKYVFFFYKQNAKITAYIVFKFNESNGRGHIVDFASEKKAALEKIFTFIINNKIFTVMSIYNYSDTEQIAEMIKRFNLKRGRLKRRKTRQKRVECPVMVRPLETNYTEKDFFIKGIDTRKFKNWSLKEICSDGA